MQGPADDGFVDTVDEIVAALREDPILVQQVMGNGYTEELDAALTELEADAAYPVYVVHTVTPSGLAEGTADEELASLVHAELGKDGVYVVQTNHGNGHVGVWGDLDPAQDDDELMFDLAQGTVEDQIDEAIATTGGDEVQPAHTVVAAAALEVAGKGPVPDYQEPILDQQELAAYTHPMWSSDHWPYPEYGDEPELATDGLLSMVGTLTLLVVAVVGYRLLQAVGARRPAVVGGADARRQRAASAGDSRSRRQVEADAQERHRDRATSELQALERRLGDRRARAQVGAAQVDLASNSHDAGAALLGSDDALDLVGAAVLARIGARAMEGDGTPYRCCYVNPLHGEGTRTRRLGGGLAVPVCARCETAMTRGEELDSLIEVRRFAVDGPYYDGESVWATTGFGALVDDLWRHVEEAGR